MNNKKGLTFIELMISITILSLLLIVSVSLFAAYTKNRATIKVKEQSVEEMSLILNEIAKKLRMSNCGEDGIVRSWAVAAGSQACYFGDNYIGGTRIKVKSNSGGYVGYEFYDNSLYQLNFNNTSGVYLNRTLIFEYVAGNFAVTNACSSLQNPCLEHMRIPLISIIMRKLDNAYGDIDTIQTSVSQRSGYSL